MPAIAHEPTGIVQSPHGAIDVGAVLDEQVGVLASGTLYRTIIDVPQPRAGASAPYIGAGRKARNEPVQDRPYPALVGDILAKTVRHVLRIEVEEHPRETGGIVDELARPRDHRHAIRGEA